MKVAAIVVALVLWLVWDLPARLVDRLVGSATADEVRLANAEGTLWHGGGLVSVSDPTGRIRRPWFHMSWDFAFSDLLRGRLGWRIATASGRPDTDLSVGLSGVEVLGLDVSGPADNFLQRISGPLGKFRWDGDMSVSTPRLACSWRGVCQGQARVRWTSAGSDFLPGQAFGDYDLAVNGTAAGYEFKWSSGRESQVRTEGSGSYSFSSGLALNGTVSGDPQLMSRLPAIAGPWARATASQDTWRIVFP